MGNWDWHIKVLDYGSITVPKAAATTGLDPDLILDWPYLGFLLERGDQKILVDTGISEKFIVDGKAWGGFPAKGGAGLVEKALNDAGVEPAEIKTILFTHLHNDHAANLSLFKNARLIFQKDDWATLLDPLPVMQVRKDYDQAIIPELKQANCVKVDGDFDLCDGIKCIKTPGHTPGSMSIVVNSEKGVRIIVGDQWHSWSMAFSQMTEQMDREGKMHKITPAPEVYGRFIPSSLIYNYYDYYDSCYRILSMMPEDKPEYLLPGHEPALLVNGA